MKKIKYGFIFKVVLIGNVLSVLIPTLFLINSSFRKSGQILSKPLAISSSLDMSNFVTVFQNGNFKSYVINSLLVTLFSEMIIITFGLLAGYALAKYRFKLNKLIYLVFLSGLLIPAKLALVPLFIQLKNMNLLDSRIGLILVYSAGALPAAVFIFTSFIKALPTDLDNAARIDGASEIQIFMKIMIPLIMPVTSIVGIYTAIPIWNDFLLPLVFIRDSSKMTIMQGLSVFFGEHANDWGALFAGLAVAALPLLFLYIVLSKQFIRGLTNGAIKG